MSEHDEVPYRVEVPSWRISWGERLPCALCGELVALRIDGIPVTAACFRRIGLQWPEGITPAAWPHPLDGLDRAAAAAAPSTPLGPPPEARVAQAHPDPVPQSDVAAEEGERAPRRRRPQKSFSVNENDERVDFHRALQRRVPDATPQQADAALEAWRQAVTVEGDPVRFVSSAGRTGIVAFQWLTEKYGSMVMPERLQSKAAWEITRSRTVLRVLSWVDPDVGVKSDMHITETDVHAQYLAAARSVEVGDGEPDELDASVVGDLPAGRQLALARCPGYLQLRSAPDLDGLPPHARLALQSVQADWWLPTPYAVYLLRDHGLMLDIGSAVIWGITKGKDGKKIKRYGKRLARWAELFERGRAALADRGDEPATHALAVLKSTYTTFLGGLLRSEEHNDTGTLRPDWYDMVVAQAGANLLRAQDKAWDAGYRSLGGMKDSVWWVSRATEFAPEGLQFADAPGRWHITRRCSVTDRIIEAHRAGRPALLRDAVIAASRESED